VAIYGIIRFGRRRACRKLKLWGFKPKNDCGRARWILPARLPHMASGLGGTAGKGPRSHS
jgi:hypothetical protein